MGCRRLNAKIGLNYAMRLSSRPLRRKGFEPSFTGSINWIGPCILLNRQRAQGPAERTRQPDSAQQGPKARPQEDATALGVDGIRELIAGLDAPQAREKLIRTLPSCTPVSLKTAVDALFGAVQRYGDSTNNCSALFRTGEIPNGCKCLWIQAGRELATVQRLFLGSELSVPSERTHPPGRPGTALEASGTPPGPLRYNRPTRLSRRDLESPAARRVQLSC